jgi:hypothetical protein
MMTTPRLMLITIIAALVYLGLTILGWGGFAAFLSHPALIALAITVLVLSGVAVFSRGNLSPGVREDRASPLGTEGSPDSPLEERGFKPLAQVPTESPFQIPFFAAPSCTV